MDLGEEGRGIDPHPCLPPLRYGMLRDLPRRERDLLGGRRVLVRRKQLFQRRLLRRGSFAFSSGPLLAMTYKSKTT